jgi:hypothetical protein
MAGRRAHRLRGAAPRAGGLIVYALGNTVPPGLQLRVPEVELDSPELPDVTANSVAADASTAG